MHLHPHKDAEFITVSDEAGETPTHFVGVRLGPDPGVSTDSKVFVATYVTTADNGFGWPVGVAIEELKHLHDNVYGA